MYRLDLRNDSGKSGRGSTGTSNRGDVSGPDDDIVVALSRDIRVCAPGLVVEAVERAIEVLDVLVDGLLLVFRCGCGIDVSLTLGRYR